MFKKLRFQSLVLAVLLVLIPLFNFNVPVASAVSHINNIAKKEIVDAYLSGKTLKVVLICTAVAYTPNPDDDVMDAGGASDPLDAECTGTGYTPGWGSASRKTLASITVTVDDINNQAYLDAPDLTWTGANFGTIAAAYIIVEGVANDTTSRLISYIDGTNLVTNGSDVTITWPIGGILVW